MTLIANNSQANTVICPVCSTGREITKPELPWSLMIWISLAWAILLGVLLGLVAGFWMGIWTGFLSGSLCFFGFEVYYRLDHKRELVCPVCHFDPILYRRSPEQAKERCLKSIEGKRQKRFQERWRALKRRRFVEQS